MPLASRRATLTLASAVCLAVLLLARLPHGAGAGADDAPAPPLRPAPVRLAITIDDLPRSQSLPAGYSSLRIVSELIATLRAHKVRSAVGFVVGERLLADTEARVALEAWTRAGFELGNHTQRHRALGEIGVAEFLADLDSLEPLIRQIEQGSGQAARYFRYPYLEEGRTTEERRLLARALQERDYRLARVSVDFFDWAWADPYARCLRRGDERALALLSRSYLEHAAARLAWSVAAAQRVFRRPFPQVLLLHANVAAAQNLDALLTEYERMGVQFISLAEALSDPAYAAEYEGSTGNVLTLASLATKRALPAWVVDPLNLLELACLE
jgi:peptidoglycan/xylan/chitin deacetylase (PgdA/CDA1 family)